MRDKDWVEDARAAMVEEMRQDVKGELSARDIANNAAVQADAMAAERKKQERSGNGWIQWHARWQRGG